MSRLRYAPLALATVAFAASVALAATTPPPAGPPPAGPPAGPGGMPQLPPYQTRALSPPGDRFAAGRDGAALFQHQCGYCHLAGGMGTNLLTKQQMMLGNTPDKGLLANRTDLNAPYVQLVVRHGKGAMPPQTRVDITDPELDAVAAYLARVR